MLEATEDYNTKRRAAGLPISRDTQRFELEWLHTNPLPRAPLSAVIDHIDHVVKVAGIDHVGLGSDSNGTQFLPAGMDSAADLPKITQLLLDRGYDPDDIKKVLGANMLRAFRDVERVSRELRAQH